MNTSPVLSVVLPALNESAGIASALQRTAAVLQTTGLSYEILVVDDGSGDDTFRITAELARQDPHIRGLRLSRRFGKEAALAAGLEHARGDAVITMDADLQHPPEIIPEMLKLWREGAQIVHGVKRERGDHGLRRGSAQLFNRLFAKAAGFELRDSSDYKLLDRKIARLLVQQLPERTRFYRGLSRWVGYEQAEVFFDVAPRHSGKTHWGALDLARYALENLTAFSALPLRLVPLLGLVMLAAALLLGIETLVSRLSGEAVSGFATLEITLLFTGSLIMIGLGIIGQYLSLIYTEIKARPCYLVAEQTAPNPSPGSNHEIS